MGFTQTKMFEFIWRATCSSVLVQWLSNNWKILLHIMLQYPRLCPMYNCICSICVYHDDINTEAEMCFSLYFLLMKGWTRTTKYILMEKDTHLFQPRKCVGSKRKSLQFDLSDTVYWVYPSAWPHYVLIWTCLDSSCFPFTWIPDPIISCSSYALPASCSPGLQFPLFNGTVTEYFHFYILNTLVSQNKDVLRNMFVISHRVSCF